MNVSIRDDTWFAPVITFLFILSADVIPVASQLVSMLVVMENKDSGRLGSVYRREDSYAATEYINSVLQAASSTGGSLLSDDSRQNQRAINGSKEFSGGLKFKNVLYKNGRSPGSNSDSDTD